MPGMRLSSTDLKILHFAVTHGLHFSDKEIGKRLRLSPSTVNYSINSLVKDRVIHGFRYKIDYRKIGLNGLAWVLFSVNTSGEGPLKLAEELIQYPEVHVVAVITGEKDIALKVIDKDISSLTQFLLKVSERFPQEIQEPAVLFSTHQFKAHNVCVDPIPKQFICDSTDLALLDKRMQHPDLPLGKIAKELSVHKNTISRRWGALCDEDVVLKKSLLINPDYYADVGIALKAIILFNVDPLYRQQFCSLMCKLPEVHEVHSLLSEYDFLVVVRTRGIPEFYSFLSKLAFDGKGIVRKSVSYIFLSTRSHPPNYFEALRKQGAISF